MTMWSNRRHEQMFMFQLTVNLLHINVTIRSTAWIETTVALWILTFEYQAICITIFSLTGQLFAWFRRKCFLIYIIAHTHSDPVRHFASKNLINQILCSKIMTARSKRMRRGWINEHDQSLALGMKFSVAVVYFDFGFLNDFNLLLSPKYNFNSIIIEWLKLTHETFWSDRLGFAEKKCNSVLCYIFLCSRNQLVVANSLCNIINT